MGLGLPAKVYANQATLAAIAIPLRSFFVFFVCFVVPSIFAAPRIHCEAPEYNFGTRDATGTVEHTFVLKNLGSDPLKIGKVRACCGASAKLEGAKNNTIPAGSSATVTIKLSLRRRKGNVRKISWVSSNDPAKALLRLTIKGEVNPTYEMSANCVNFGDISPGQQVEPKQITLTWPKEHRPKRLRLEVSSADFSAQFLSRTATGVTVSIRPASNLLPGQAKARIIVTTGNPEYPRLEALAVADVHGPVNVTPRQVILTGGAADTQRPRYLSVRRSTGQSFRITRIDVPEGIHTTTRAVAGGSWRIAMDFKDFNPNSDQTSAIVICTDADEASLTIPITVSSSGDN